MKIDALKRKDVGKVIDFAIRGMHFDEYLKNPFLLKAYGLYFWYLEYSNSNHIIAAYDEDELQGVLLVDMKNKPKNRKTLWQSFYIKTVDLIQNLFFKGGVMPYNEANKAMYAKYLEKYTPDGEIRFLAAKHDSKNKGIGTFLLNELEKREKGSEIYLYTDTNCTYQFYEHRGFERIGEQDVVLEFENNTNLKCLMYRKKI